MGCRWKNIPSNLPTKWRHRLAYPFMQSDAIKVWLGILTSSTWPWIWVLTGIKLQINQAPYHMIFTLQFEQAHFTTWFDKALEELQTV